MIQVIDAFMFCGLGGELDLAELRFHELEDAVDVHVVVEAKQTFQGEPHKPVFPALLSRLGRFRSKIQYHTVDLPASSVYPRAPGGRERYLRNALATYLPRGGPDDIIMISDCDEIPRASVLWDVCRNGWVTPVQLGMTPYYLHMNLRIRSDVSEAPGQRHLWNGTLLVRRPTLDTTAPYTLRDVPGRRLAPNAGWHFSSLGGPEAMQRKLAAWGHPDRNIAPLNTIEHLTACYENGEDWDTGRAGGPLQMEWVEIDKSYPAYVLAHPERFQRYLGGVEVTA